MKTAEYFVYLLSCYLNSQRPQGEKEADWQAIYDLAKRNSVTAMIAYEIRQLPRDERPKGDLPAKFEAEYDAANNSYYKKFEALAFLTNVLSASKIQHLIVKGADISNLYPVPELRTSSDADVVIRQSDFMDAVDLLRQNGFKVGFFSNSRASLSYENEVFELDSELESLNIQGKIHFSAPFDDPEVSEAEGYTYTLRPMSNLLYVITNLARHLQVGEANIKMIMDIDVLVRNCPEIGMERFTGLCDNLRIRRTAYAVLALSKKWFDTPLAIDFTFADRENAQLYETMEAAVLEGHPLGEPLKREENKKTPLLKRIWAALKSFFTWLFPLKRKKRETEVFDCSFTKEEIAIFEELSVKPRGS